MLLLSLNLLKRPRSWAFLHTILLCMFPSLSYSAAWTLAGTVDQSLGYDTNVRMRGDQQGSFEYKITPVLTFSRKTETTEIQADASYGTQVYTDIVGLDQDNQKYGISGLYRMERFVWGLSGGYSVTPTRNTAINDSGDFNASSENTTWSVSPSLTYKASERDSLVLSPSYSESSFTGADAATFRNRNNININLGWQHAWTERYSTTSSVFYSTSDSQRGSTAAETQTSFDSVGINLSNTYKLSEQWNLNGTIGIRHTESEIDFLKSSSFGFLAGSSIDYKGENFSSGVNFNRSLVPSNQGQLQEQTGVGLNLSYKFAEHLSAGFNTSYQESTRINEIDQSTRTNITVQPSVHWHIAPEWTLTGSYRYRSQEGTVSTTRPTGSVDSNLFMLSINYNWQGLNISR